MKDFMQLSPFSLRHAVVLLALCAVGATALGQSAATSAATDPVGFVTLTIPGTNGVGTNAISFKSLGLTTPVVYQGAAEGINVAAKTIADQDAAWTDNQFNGVNGAYYVEIVRPVGQVAIAPGEGTTYDIASTVASTKTITTVQPLASTLVAGATFKIRKHWTIGAVFGLTNQAGLQGGDVSTADQIRIFNQSAQTFSVFYYLQGVLGNGWKNAADGSDASAQVIYPDDGLVVNRTQSSAVQVIVMGAVKTGQSSFPVLPGSNILANVYAAPMTLNSCGLYTGDASTGVASGDASSADQVMIYNSTTGSYDIYYYLSGFLGSGWRNAADGSDATTVPIAVGASVIVKRVGAVGFNWVMPQHPTTL